MDTTDPEILFDEQGNCNHCTTHLATLTDRPSVEVRAEQLARLIDHIKAAGKGRPYDCLIGVSGGVDSTFVAYKVREYGLRPLAVHLDNGWDSELAVANIEKVLKTLEIDLHTLVLDWDEFRDLQLAFLRASVSDAEIPSDHAICASMLRTAIKLRIPYVISGVNVEHEGILPREWTYGVMDWRYIRAVHRRYGTMPLRSYPRVSLATVARYFALHRLKSCRLLDYLDYNKQAAMDVLINQLGWQYYGGKHYESIYTRFFQSYILPVKFGIDKRKAHYSSLICAGQMTRDEAIEQMAQPACPPDMVEADREYVLKKLGLLGDEFEAIMAAPPRSYEEFPNCIGLMQAVQRPVGWAKQLGILPDRSSV